MAVAFANFAGALTDLMSGERYLIPPIVLVHPFTIDQLSFNGYALSLSTQQLLAVVMILFLTFINTRGLFLWSFETEDNVAARPLIVGDLVIGVPAGELSTYPDELIDDRAELQRSAARLLDFDFEALLLCDGKPLSSGGKDTLQDFVASAGR